MIEISKAAERSAALTRQLLAFSRKQIIHPQIIDLNDLIANMDQMLRRLIGEDIALVTTLEPDPHQVRVDLSQMEQVMMNLVVNARDAMPYGGRLQIETQNVQLTEGYDHQGAHIEPGDYVLLLVRDNGQGMDDEMLSHIFEPFFTTKAKGTGLGLATVYGIIKQNQGYIFVRSRPGKGTAFEIYLPSAHGPSEPIARQSPAVTIRQGHETILLVEDDVGVRSLAKQILEQSDYTVLTAGNAEQALLIAQAQPPPIHLLLTDVVMPGSLSGTALAERLQNIHPETKVMYMSGYTDETIVQHGVLEPGIHFLHKPFTTAALTAQVRKVLDR